MASGSAHPALSPLVAKVKKKKSSRKLYGGGGAWEEVSVRGGEGNSVVVRAEKGL